MNRARALYGSNDLLGYFLSNWRLRAVSPMIRGRLLDLACGDNRLVQQYRQMGNDGTGVDINDYGADIVTQEFHRLSVPDKSFNTVTIVASINYFPDPLPVLNEVRRIIADNGSILVTMSNATVLKIWHIFREPWAHKSGICGSDLIDLFSQAGFRLQRRRMFMFGINAVYEFKKDDAKTQKEMN